MKREGGEGNGGSCRGAHEGMMQREGGEGSEGVMQRCAGENDGSGGWGRQWGGQAEVRMRE